MADLDVTSLFPGVTGDRKPQTPRRERPLFGLPCDIGLCGFMTNGDDKALWGECPVCGAVAGYIEREKVRAYMEAEDARRSPATTPHEGKP